MVKYITYYVTHDRRHVLSGRSDQVNRGNWPIGQAQDCKLCQVSSILTLPSLRFDPLPNVLHPQMDNERELPIDKWPHMRQMARWRNWQTLLRGRVKGWASKFLFSLKTSHTGSSPVLGHKNKLPEWWNWQTRRPQKP